MSGRFTSSNEVERDQLDWGELGWLSRPQTTSASASVVVEVILHPGQGHDFHKHPQQEEVVYVISGEVEQWIATDKRTLKTGDSAYIPADTVHASFNTGDTQAKLIVVLAPCIGEGGYELVDLSDKSPWNAIR